MYPLTNHDFVILFPNLFMLKLLHESYHKHRYFPKYIEGVTRNVESRGTCNIRHKTHHKNLNDMQDSGEHRYLRRVNIPVI